MNVIRYRTQHREIAEICGKISGLLNAVELKKDASGIRDLLSVLYGKLIMHLAMEDKSLYPSLLGHENTEIRQTANRLFEEKKAVSRDFNNFKVRWTENYIRENTLAFIKEIENFLSSLADRIAREEKELLPLLEKLA